MKVLRPLWTLGSHKAFQISLGNAHQPQLSGGDLSVQQPVVGVAESSKICPDLGKNLLYFQDTWSQQWFAHRYTRTLWARQSVSPGLPNPRLSSIHKAFLLSNTLITYHSTCFGTKWDTWIQDETGLQKHFQSIKKRLIQAWEAQGWGIVGDEIPDVRASHEMEAAPSRISSLAINRSFGTSPRPQIGSSPAHPPQRSELFTSLLEQSANPGGS